MAVVATNSWANGNKEKRDEYCVAWALIHWQIGVSESSGRDVACLPLQVSLNCDQSTERRPLAWLLESNKGYVVTAMLNPLP